MPISDWTPDLAYVGALLRARTVDDDGAELGTFTPATRPTDTEASMMIDLGVGEVTGDYGSADYDPSLWPIARRLSALETALLIELSYYPEQVATGRSPYEQLVALRDRAAASLKKAMMELAAGEDVGPSDDELMPSYSFPTDAGGMIGWGTQW